MPTVVAKITKGAVFSGIANATDLDPQSVPGYLKSDGSAVSIAAINLDDLADVSVPSPTNGYFVYWDAATSLWKCKALAATDIPNLDAAKITSGIFDAARLAGRAGEGHITILAPSYNSIGQGTWVIQAPSTYFYLGALRNSTLADGDNVLYKIYLDAGTYTLFLLTQTGIAHPIVDFDIAAVEVASFDLYVNAPTTNNVIKTQTGIVTTAGLKTLTVRVHGKNPASNNYNLYIQYIALWRTA